MMGKWPQMDANVTLNYTIEKNLYCAQVQGYYCFFFSSSKELVNSHMSVCWSVRLFVCRSVGRYVCLSGCLLVSTSVCQAVCLQVSQWKLGMLREITRDDKDMLRSSDKPTSTRKQKRCQTNKLIELHTVQDLIQKLISITTKSTRRKSGSHQS